MGRREDEPTYTPANVLRIMISTDNHLGYLEKDPIRGDDSFRSFEEFLMIAKANKVDFILLGGDLFHENKPSRRTIVRTMSLLRRFCLGRNPVSVLVRKGSAINYMDPFYAVELPVFTIHGNHDDPTGSTTSTGTDALSAVDLLSMSNLVTYFGKASHSQRITIPPILLQKGITKLALYGLGNVRDERLYNTWYKEKKVHWQRPAVKDDDEDPWYNLFVLHQNRAIRGTTKAISESMLPEWLDLVIWGHEHESIRETSDSTPPVMQPGSTVATSLSEGESQKKHCALLEVYRGRGKVRWIPLQTPRMFIFDTISLSNIQKDQERRGLVATGDDDEDDQGEIIIAPDDEKNVTRYLKRRVEQMITMATARFQSQRESWRTGAVKPERGTVYPSKNYYLEALSDRLAKPLIRLRVEYSGGYEPINAARFGQDFIGKAACPSEILLFFRKRVTARKRFLAGRLDGSDDVVVPGTEEMVDPLEAIGEEEDDEGFGDGRNEDPGSQSRRMSIPRLVQYYLYHRGKSTVKGIPGLKFLELDSLSAAVEKFVEKKETSAIPEYVEGYLENQLKDTVKKQKAEGKLFTENEIREKFEKDAYSAAARVFKEEKERGLEESQSAEARNSGESGERSVATRERGMNSNGHGNVQSDRLDELRDSMEKAASNSLAGVQELISAVPELAQASIPEPKIDEDIDFDDDDDDAMPRTAAKRTAKPKKAARGRRKATTGRGRPTASRKRTRSEIDSDDSFAEGGDEDEYIPPAKKRRAPVKSSTGSRAPRSRAGSQATLTSGSSFTRRRDRRAKASPVISLDSDDEGDNVM